MTITTCPQMIQSVSYGHDDGVQPIRDVRLEWTYARGSRVCYGACDQMVGMFFSLFYVFIFLGIIWECKGSLFQFIYKIFYHFSMKITIFSSKYGSAVHDDRGHTCKEPFLMRCFAIAVDISSARSPPFR